MKNAECWDEGHKRGKEEVSVRKLQRDPLADVAGADEKTIGRLVFPLTAVLNKATTNTVLFNHEISREPVVHFNEKL